jgi:hypothetical protein
VWEPLLSRLERAAQQARAQAAEGELRDAENVRAVPAGRSTLPFDLASRCDALSFHG